MTTDTYRQSLLNFSGKTTMLLILFMVLAWLQRSTYGAQNPSSTGTIVYHSTKWTVYNQVTKWSYQLQTNFDIEDVLQAISSHEETTYKDFPIEPYELPPYKENA